MKPGEGCSPNTMHYFYIDTETRHDDDIKKIGGYKHARLAECILATFAHDDDDVEIWEPLEDPRLPPAIREAIEDPSVVWVAHQVAYDRLVLQSNFNIDIPIERWLDTVALAYTVGLPGSLDQLCEALGLPQDERKLKDGKKLIQKFSKPRRPSKANPAKYWDKYSKPAEWERFREYGRLDIVSMRAAHKRMPLWNLKGDELELWRLDQRMNERGIGVDLVAIEAAVRTVNKVVAALDEETQRITGGAIESTRQTAEVKTYLTERIGVPVDSIAKAAVSAMIDRGELDPVSRRLLEIRQQAGRSSTAKLEKMRAFAIDTDDRGPVLQGMFQYYGAFRTGRWAGRDVQLQNQPRGSFEDPQEVLNAVDSMLLDVTDVLYDDPMDIAASCIRPMLVPSPGKEMYVSDLSNIEGRVIAWVPNEAWKIRAFEEFDAGHGHDIYKLAYARSFGVDPSSVTKDQRQVGKCQELALGFEGGVGAFVNMANTYRLDLDDTYAAVWPNAKDGFKVRAEKALERDRSRDRLGEISEEAYLACDVLKQMWRGVHPEVVKEWRACKEAAHLAVKNPGKVYKAGRLRFKMARQWLLTILPSGRALCYYRPSIKRNSLHFWGLLQTETGRRIWVEQSIHGGKLFQNAVQAIARDVLAYNMPRAQAAGFTLLGSVHDEVITESEPGRDVAELDAILATNPPWADGLPLAAGGFRAPRYMKAA